jgi:hypothetical protein
MCNMQSHKTKHTLKRHGCDCREQPIYVAAQHWTLAQELSPLPLRSVLPLKIILKIVKLNFVKTSS